MMAPESPTTLSAERQTELPAAPSSIPAAFRAAVVVEPRRIEMVERPTPEPGPGEVLVRLEGCGVCASNLPPWEGREWFRYPMEPGGLGHEGWGVVAAVGPGVTQVAVGQRVAMLSGHAYAEFDVAPEDSVIPLPPSLNGQPFPGEPLGCAINIFRRSGIRAGDTVAIIGIGFLGALLTRLASRAGARVLALARKPYALEVARQQGAAEALLMDDHWRLIEAVKERTAGQFCDVVVEATGKQWPLDLSAELTRERGRLIIAGYHQDGLRQVNLQLWNWRGLDVINAHEREQQVYVDGIRAAVDAVESGVLAPAPLLTHTYPLDELAAALDATCERPDGFMKALVVMR